VFAKAPNRTIVEKVGCVFDRPSDARGIVDQRETDVEFRGAIDADFAPACIEPLPGGVGVSSPARWIGD